MKQQLQAIAAEFIKNRHSRIRWVTFVAFAIAPLMGGVFLYMMKDQGYDGLAGAMRSKAIMLSFEANWDSYLSLLSQAVGVGGVLIFGFVASWLFGREYSDGTVKDLLALPISRTKILNAKYIYYLLWCFALVISNLLIGLLIGGMLQLEGWSMHMFLENMNTYFITTALILLLNTPIAFFALWGKGYLPPLGAVALLLVFSQIIGAMGGGVYFPWSIPGIYAGSGGAEFQAEINSLSFAIIILTGLIGYIASILWWKHADQH